MNIWDRKFNLEKTSQVNKTYAYTEIKADKTVVFDLSRSIDLHKISTEQTNQQAIAGKTSGLIGINENVTWRAKHFGV